MTINWSDFFNQLVLAIKMDLFIFFLSSLTSSGRRRIKYYSKDIKRFLEYSIFEQLIKILVKGSNSNKLYYTFDAIEIKELNIIMCNI